MLFKQGFTLDMLYKSVHVFSKEVRVYHHGALVYRGFARIGWGDFPNKKVQHEFDVLMDKYSDCEVRQFEQVDDYTVEITLRD